MYGFSVVAQRRLGRRRRAVLAVALSAAMTVVSLLAWGTTPASAKKAKTYELSKEVKKAFTSNPAGAWSFMYGSANTPATYGLMTSGSTAGCGAKPEKKVQFWRSGVGGGGGTYPHIEFNKGGEIASGDDSCAPRDAFAKNSVTLQPEFEGFGNLYAIVAWTAPATGKYTFSGSLKLLDSKTEGIRWEVDQGSSFLVGPTEDHAAGSLVTFGPEEREVKAGEALYLEVGDAGGSFPGGADETTVTMTVTG